MFGLGVSRAMGGGMVAAVSLKKAGSLELRGGRCWLSVHWGIPQGGEIPLRSILSVATCKRKYADLYLPHFAGQNYLQLTAGETGIGCE
jgi:hypothetical protein